MASSLIKGVEQTQDQGDTGTTGGQEEHQNNGTAEGQQDQTSTQVNTEGQAQGAASLEEVDLSLVWVCAERHWRVTRCIIGQHITFLTALPMPQFQLGNASPFFGAFNTSINANLLALPGFLQGQWRQGG